MNDAFVGDIGDYGKYGLLRVLNREAGFRLGIVWMKTKPIAGTSDRPFEYLDTSVKGKELMADCDPKLYRILKGLVDSGRPTIADLEASHALPGNTTYFDELLDFGGMPANDGTAFRSSWFTGAFACLQDTRLVFFDPDNGLEIPSMNMKRHTANGPKYVWYDELRPFYDRGQSLIVYQHAGRKGKFETAIRERARDLREKMGCKSIWALRWHRMYPRVYFLIPTAEHLDRIEQAIRWLEASPWCKGDHPSVTVV